MPKKEPIQKYKGNLDGYPVLVEIYESVIKVSDDENNLIKIDKRKGKFRLTLEGLYSFKN